MNGTELNALLKFEISATRNSKRVTANCGLRFAVCQMLKVSNKGLGPDERRRTADSFVVNKPSVSPETE